MDERRDPGEYYPGGRVMVRPDVAPPQMEVNVSWSEIRGKPDFSDVAELGAADSLGSVKLNMNKVVNKLKTSVLIGWLLAVGTAFAAVAPQFAALNDIPGNQQIMTNTQEYVRSAVVDATNGLVTASITNGLATVAEAANIATNCTDAAIAELYGALQSGSFAPAMSAQSQQAILSEGLIDVASARTMQSAEIFSRLDAAAETNEQQSAELSTNYYTIAQTEVAITSHVPTNILFRNDMTGQSYDQPSTFGINPESDWMSIDFPGYTKFYYPNSNQVSKISKDAVADSDTSYPRFTSPTNLNQCVQYLTTAPGGVLPVEIPTDGDTKDWIAYAYFGVETPLVLPPAIWWMADEAYTNAIPSNTPTALYFSQVADGIFTLSRQELKSVEIVAP